MAPTEMLVQQHAGDRAQARGAARDRKSQGGTGDLRAAERCAPACSASRLPGDATLVIGTHALLEDSVEFARLGVIVVDEQHRFGVEQRLPLSERPTRRADALHMTATPIPRSLALSLYGDLDLTELRELPPGRTPIITRRVHAGKRQACHEWLVREWLEHGRQAYVVCALVEGSETVQARAAEELHAELVNVLAPLNVGLVHGRQKAAERAATMRAFAAAEVHVLVATTVIEVGIDVPNATAMVIEDADRFGLSQLHQLRGRVGRGSDQSYCFLFESPEPGELGQRRLSALCEHASGFDLAELDLKMRGEGELSGVAPVGCHRPAPREPLPPPAADRALARRRATAGARGPLRSGARPGRARALRRARRADRAGVKIIAGSLGGRVLATPRGRLVRPTTGRVREALFQRLGPLDGGAALDLFAGSGALGFEALSRGAATCLFADTAAASIACLRANVKALGLEGRATVRRADFKRVLRDEARSGARYGLVLLDPPYEAAAGLCCLAGRAPPPCARAGRADRDRERARPRAPARPPRRPAPPLRRLDYPDSSQWPLTSRRRQPPAALRSARGRTTR